MSTPLLCLFIGLICISNGSNLELSPNPCASHTRCSLCLKELHCVWVLNPEGVPDVCERYTNQTKYRNGTCSTPCQSPTFGLSDSGFCSPLDYLVVVAAPFVSILSALIFIAMSRIKQNAMIQEKALTNEYLEPQKQDRFDSVAMDWVWFWMLCSPSLLALFMNKPLTSLVFILPTVLYCVACLLYCLFCFGYRRSIELYSFQYELSNRSPLACLIEGREATESKRIDNWNRHHLSVFVSDAAGDEVLEYLEYTRFSDKLASQLISFCSIGAAILGFIVALLSIVDSTILEGHFGFPFLFFVPLIILSFGASSDCLLIVTNRRSYFSEHYFFVPLLTYFTIDDLKAEVVDGIVYDKLIPCLTGKNFYKGSNFLCYFFDEENFIQYLNSKNIMVENDFINQAIFNVALAVTSVVLPAGFGVTFLIVPLPLVHSIYFLILSFILYFVLALSFFRSTMRLTFTALERKRALEENAAATESESLFDSSTKYNDEKV